MYLITNLVNGKVYVGKTINSLRKRWNDHQYAARNRQRGSIPKAIAKYGPENFTMELIETCVDRESLTLAEIRWIAHYDSMNRTKGYNLTPGGESGHAPGFTNVATKLTWEDVRALRLAFEKQESSRSELANRYGVAEAHVNQILAGRRWAEPGIKTFTGPNKQKLTEEDIRSIRDEYARGNATYEELGKRYGTCASGIRGVVNGSRRGGVQGGRLHKTKIRFTDEQAKEIRAAHARGVSRKELREQYGTSKGTIGDILNGKTHRRCLV